MPIVSECPVFVMSARVEILVADSAICVLCVCVRVFVFNFNIYDWRDHPYSTHVSIVFGFPCVERGGVAAWPPSSAADAISTLECWLR